MEEPDHFLLLINHTNIIFREWMGKVERVRPRPSDSQEGWTEGSEDRGGNKTSWADSTDPRAPSPGSMGQYSKSAATQDYQVKLDMHYISLPLCLHCTFKRRVCIYTNFCLL